jgi:signal transduction histidine kinase
VARPLRRAGGADLALERLRGLLAGLGRADRKTADALAAAAGLEPAPVDEAGERLLLLSMTGDVVSALALDRPWTQDESCQLVERLADLTGVAAETAGAVVWSRALRDPRALELPPLVALDSQLRLVYAFAPLEELSFWTAPLGRAECFLHLGDGRPSRRVRLQARRVLQGHPEEPPGVRAHIHVVPVLRWQRPAGALVFRARPGGRDRALAIIDEASPMVGALLEKDSLLERDAERERALAESTERRLVRLGFDLHDGALQDVAALVGDLRLFRSQLSRELSGHETRDHVLGRVDDLAARVLSIDTELRELSRSLESPSLAGKALPSALREEVDAFASRTEIRAELEVEGEFGDLSDSQRIAVTRIVQEALSNVREHSGATEVHVSVTSARDRVRAEVTDNGRGFDVERTVIRAARSGRLGLIGMSERARLLGGTLELTSRPGGPTVIAVTLPAWRPIAAGEPAAPTSAPRAVRSTR